MAVEKDPLQAIHKAYRADKIEMARESKKRLKLVQTKVDKLEDLITEKIVKAERGKYLPSKITSAVMSGKYKTVFRNNLEVMKSSNRFMEAKEYMLLSVKHTASINRSDMRARRESLKGVFMTDPLVLSTVSTIKHQEKLFEVIFADFLDNYRNILELENKVQLLDDFLVQGFRNLSAVSKMLYNAGFQEAQDFNGGVEEAKPTKKRVRKKRVSVEN